MHRKKEYLDLYKKGFSTYQIAKILNVLPNLVRNHINKAGIVRPSIGIIVEQQVAVWLEAKGKKVITQPGNAKFDLLVDSERIDVKSAKRCLNKQGTNRWGYKFQLTDYYSRGKEKVFTDFIDYFYLVFRDLHNMPVYSLAANKLQIKQTLSIKHPLETKYNLKLLGFLEGG